MKAPDARLRAPGLLTLALLLVTPTPGGAQDACRALTSTSIPGATVVSSTSVPADAATKTPVFCEVKATLTPAPGSRIGATYRLPAVLGAPVMAYVVKADPAYDVLTFDPERDMAALKGGLAGEHLHQLKTDISAFVNRGGKLLLWHGFNDPGPSPLSTIEYLEEAQSKVPAAR